MTPVLPGTVRRVRRAPAPGAYAAAMTLAASAQSHRRAFGAILVGYVVALALVLAWPTPVQAQVKGVIAQLLEWLYERGMPSWVGYAEVEFAANIALLVPVGLLLTLALRRGRWWIAVLTGFGVSLLAELAQGSLRPERFATGRDVVANTLGTAIGAGIAVLVMRHRRPPPSARPLPAVARPVSEKS